MGSKFNTKMLGTEIPQLGWQTVGTIDATAGDADGALDVTERDFATANALDNTIVYYIPPEIQTLEIRTYFSTNDEDGIMDIWAMRDGGTEMKRVCTLTCKGGTQTITIGSTTKYLSDVQSVSNNGWPATPVTYTAANTMAVTRFSPDGYSMLLFHGHSTVDEDFVVQVSGY